MATTDIGASDTPSVTTPARTTAMRAVVQEGDGSADVLHLREMEVPALAADRVLVRVRASSVNAADYHGVHGGLLIRVAAALMRAKSNPVAGRDVAGVVEAVGTDVHELRQGDEVFGTAPGAWAEYASASPRGLALKPERLSFTQAGAIGVAALTALQGLRDQGGVRAGQRVLVYGAGGGVGTFAVQIAKALGAHVTAVTSTRNLELIRPLGPDELYDYTKEDVLKRGQRYDVVLDVAANRPLGALRRAVAPGGTLVMVGASKSGGFPGLFARIIASVIRRRVLKQPVIMFVAKVRGADLAFLKQLVDEGKVTPVIDREYPLSEIREAVRYAGSGQGRAKVVINVS
jgi:NADPH:quinone reductase-like Zn-dependent oxidoreductase